MYVQSRPRWLWDLASSGGPGEARRSVPRGPSAVGPPPIGEIATSRAREVFSTDRVAHATVRLSFSALFSNNSCIMHSRARVHFAIPASWDPKSHRRPKNSRDHFESGLGNVLGTSRRRPIVIVLSNLSVFNVVLRIFVEWTSTLKFSEKFQQSWSL